MKRFEQQRQYNPTTYQLPQGPLQAPDIASQIRADYQRKQQSDSFYLNQLQQNDKVESANMRISLDKVQQETKRDLDYSLNKLIPFSNKLFGVAETAVAAEGGAGAGAGGASAARARAARDARGSRRSRAPCRAA